MPDERERPETFAFLPVPGFSMMSLMSAIEPLRALNRLLGRTAYRWRFVGPDAGVATATCGLPVPMESFAGLVPEIDYLFVCGGLRIQLEEEERRYLALLREARRRGLRIGSLSTGTYLLARAGLLDGYRCTIHWENRAAFRETFAHLECTTKIYEIDRDRLTCSGGTAAMDLVLHLIEDAHGSELAQRVANQFHHERIRSHVDDQRGGRIESLNCLPGNLRTAVEIMHARIEEPLPVPDIAMQVGLSARQLERLFLAHVGRSPLRYYMELRLDRARELLLYSDLQVIEIAVQVGFTSTSHLASWYSRVYGMRPSDARTRKPLAQPAQTSETRR